MISHCECAKEVCECLVIVCDFECIDEDWVHCDINVLIEGVAPYLLHMITSCFDFRQHWTLQTLMSRNMRHLSLAYIMFCHIWEIEDFDC